jgi:aminoglycoside/choline kinase family phosphotransferase
VPDNLVPSPILEYLTRHAFDDARVVALTADASDRRYFRIVPRGRESFVLALHTQPFAPGSLPFVNVAELFAAIPLPVPRVRGEAPDLGILVLDDLGDVTLQAHLGAAPAAEREAWYARAVEHIAVLQGRGRELADSRFLPFTLAFDVEKLTWEMDFFLRHFLEGYRRIEFSPSARAALRAELVQLAEELAAEPRVLCHRDYHSRNLMVHGGELFVIDFQDARLGPDTYDLVSLLRDSYVDLTEPFVDTMVARFCEAARVTDSPATFRMRFDVMALQRNLKALGTFGYQAVARANPVYAQYVPRTLRYVRDNLGRHDRFAAIASLLGDRVPELV